MNHSFNMRIVACLFVALGTLTSVGYAADGPVDRVVLMYFHRTERCPTCKKMGSYAEEAVKTAYGEQLKAGGVSFHFIDFQDSKNAKFTKAYKITGPSLIIAKVRGNKVAEFRDLDAIWEKVTQKPEFLAYVQAAVDKYLQ